MSAPLAPAADPAATSFRPAGALDLSNALEPYAGPWTVRQAAHLYRRAGFGGSPDDVATALRLGVHGAVDAFVRFPDTSSLPGQPQLAQDYRQAAALRLGAAAVPSAMPAAKLDDATIVQLRKQIGQTRRGNAIAMQQWFLDRMIQTPAPLQEKMTLFWHGHFTSAYQKGIPAFALVNQNNLFRQYALGNIRELTLRVSQDPAMLRYLDNAQNVKAHPNENYARELMELFTLGIGNYTETDVRESARAFTGYTLGRDYTFVNDPRRHDDGAKTFLGKTGNFDGAQIVDIIFQQPAAARWFAAKLLNFFVYNDPEPALVNAVAALIVKNGFNLQPTMSTLLRSNLFFSDRAYRALVKSPVEFVVGGYQLYGIKSSELPALASLRRMGQLLFYPPNVKGWDGGAQWLNSQTMLARENFAQSLMTRMNGATWFGRALQSMDAATVARSVTQSVLQGDVSPASAGRLVAYLDGSGTSALTKLSGENADERVRGAAYLTMAMPAYQLA